MSLQLFLRNSTSVSAIVSSSSSSSTCTSISQRGRTRKWNRFLPSSNKYHQHNYRRSKLLLTNNRNKSTIANNNNTSTNKNANTGSNAAILIPSIRTTASIGTRSYVRSSSSSTATSSTKELISYVPPLPIRVALVSTSTALCTPIFPAIGFVNLCLRIMLPNQHTRQILSTSMITSILSIACWNITPFFYSISPLLLPFALSNGLCAGVAYGILDVGSGGPAAGSSHLNSSNSSSISSSRRLLPSIKNSNRNPILSNPIITGGGIGVFTGYMAPTYCYSEAFQLLYGTESMIPIMQDIMSVPFVTEISCTTGFVAGCAMYPILHYPMYGIPNIPWMHLSGLVLLGTTVTSYNLYTTNSNNNIYSNSSGISSNNNAIANLVPDGAFVQHDLVPLLDSIIRYNVKTRKFGLYSLSSYEWIEDSGGNSCSISSNPLLLSDKNGPDHFHDDQLQYYEQIQQLAQKIRTYQKENDSWGEKYTFDNEVLSFLCHYIVIDRQSLVNTYLKHIVKTKDVQYLDQHRNMFYKTDWVVDFIMERRRRGRTNDGQITDCHNDNINTHINTDTNTSISTTPNTKQQSSVLSFDQKVEMFSIYDKQINKRKGVQLLKSIEKASIGIELLLIMKQRDMKEIYIGDKLGVYMSIDTIEKWVRRQKITTSKSATTPGIILYDNEESATNDNNGDDDCYYYKGQSIESQLTKLSSTSSSDDTSSSTSRYNQDNYLKQCTNMFQDVLVAERQRKHTIVATTTAGVLAAFLSGVATFLFI